jgi:hypothetical protein
MDLEKESNESFFARYKAKKMGVLEDETEEFNMRLMEQFCADFQKAGNPADVPQWIMNEFVKVFLPTLIYRTPLNVEFPLPWDAAKSEISRATLLDMKITREITQARISNPMENVTEIIERVAAAHNVSFSKAKKAYYKLKMDNNQMF